MSTAGSGTLRRIGGAMIALALTALGLAAGLFLGGPAGAADTDTIQVKMAGQGDFADFAPDPLLDIADLAPGRSVSGTMELRDNSGATLENDFTDTISLTMIDVTLGAACSPDDSGCPDASTALAGALRFSLLVKAIPSGTVLRQSAETLASLRLGVPLATGLKGGDEIRVQLSAWLPFDSVGNEVADGSVGFNLQLDLLSVGSQSAEETSGGDDGSGAGDGSGPAQPGDGGADNSDDGGSSDRAAEAGGDDTDGGPGDIEVLDTSHAAAPPVPSTSQAGPSKPGTVVLGRDKDDLASTGTPIITLAGTAIALLIAGSLILSIARRRRAHEAR